MKDLLCNCNIYALELPCTTTQANNILKPQLKYCISQASPESPNPVIKVSCETKRFLQNSYQCQHSKNYIHVNQITKDRF